MPNNSEGDNIRALRGMDKTPDLFVGLVEDTARVEGLLDLFGAIGGEIDIRSDAYNALRKKYANPKSLGFAQAFTTLSRVLRNEKTVLQRLSGPLDLDLLAQLDVAVAERARGLLQRAAMAGETSMDPRFREHLMKELKGIVEIQAGIEPGMSRRRKIPLLIDYFFRALTHPWEIRKGYAPLLLNSGMDTPTAAFHLEGAMQKVMATSDAIRKTTRHETRDITEGKTPTGPELESLIYSGRTEVNAWLKNGTAVPIEVGVARCMDFFFGNLGKVKMRNGEPLYQRFGKDVTLIGLKKQLRPDDYAKALADGSLQPVLTYSPFAPKSFMGQEAAWSDMPAEEFQTMPAWENIDSGSKRWVAYLIAEAGIDPKDVVAVDVDVLVDESGKTQHLPKADAASDLEPITRKHPNVIGKGKDLVEDGLSGDELEREIGIYMLQESLAARFSKVKNLAAAIFDCGNETALLDPALHKNATPDAFTKAHQANAYAQKYGIGIDEARESVLLPMWGPVTGYKIKYWAVIAALKGDGRHLRFRNPLATRDTPELQAIEFPEMDTASTTHAQRIIEDVFFGTRRYRGKFSAEHREANEVIQLARAGVPDNKLTEVVDRIRAKRIKELVEERRSPVKIIRSRQDMFALVEGMSLNDRKMIKNVDFKGYLASMGYENMDLANDEYRGWLGLLKAVEIHSFEHFDWGEQAGVIDKEMKYAQESAGNMYAGLALMTELTNTITDYWKKAAGGVDLNALKTGMQMNLNSFIQQMVMVTAEEFSKFKRTPEGALGYIDNVLKAFEKAADISYQDQGNVRKILVDLIDTLDCFVGAFDSSTHFVMKKGRGEPGSQRTLLTLDMRTKKDQLAARALRRMGKRVVVPGNYLLAYVTSDDGAPLYVIQGKVENEEFKPVKGPKSVLTPFGHLGREPMLVYLTCMFALDRNVITLEDTSQVIELCAARDKSFMKRLSDNITFFTGKN